MTIYQEQAKKKKALLSLKNNYFAIIYEGVLKGKTVKQIHKALFDATINKKVTDKVLFVFATKVAKKAKKVDNGQGSGALAIALVDLFTHIKGNDKAKKIINHGLMEESSARKDELLVDFLEDNREAGRIFYLASSHDDCAEDHKPYQGKIYVDSNWKSIIGANSRVEKYISDHHIMTFQWVLGKPAWFITRPNCRHYFVSIPTNKVVRNSVKSLKKSYHTHTEAGDYDFQTPPRQAVEEYEDRLRYLKSLYRVRPNEKLKRMIDKTELLLKKWKKHL